MRILEVITDTNIGGAGILLLTRCEYMDRTKYDVTVALPKGSKLLERFAAIGIEVVEVDGCYDRSLEWKSIPKWIALLKDLKPVLVNCHGCLSCRMAARICRIPVLLDTRHCAFPLKRWQTQIPAKVILGKGLTALSDHTIAVADAAKQNLVEMGVNSQKICVIINGAKPIRRLGSQEKMKQRERLGFSSASIVVGIFARLEVCKGHKTFLLAARELLEENPCYRFLIVGDGTQKDHLQETAKELGISDETRLVGFAEDVAPYLNVTDILVNCSLGTETSSLALSEAMSLGIPVIASDFGGNPYMVKNGENGFLFPMNRADLLAKEIRRVAEDDLLYRRLSEGAQRRFDTELNAERMTKETEALYEQCLLKRKR